MLDRSKTSFDPLSDILGLLQPRNIACGAIDSGGACIDFPESHGIKCHAVTAGTAWLAVDGVNQPIRVAAGDCFILPRGRPYRLGSDLSLPPVDYRVVLDGRPSGQLTTWNGGGQATIVSAFFTLQERNAGFLLDALPPVVLIGGDASLPSLRPSLDQMMEELHDPRPGSRLIVEHLATMLLAQALRVRASQAGSDEGGWLSALADRKIGLSLGAMHGEPAYAWTVQALAEQAGMSRTSFAVRFKSRVGSSPMEYLTRLKMLMASNRLSSTNASVQEVAQNLGYKSESAFSHAFKRHLGSSPRTFSKMARQANT